MPAPTLHCCCIALALSVASPAASQLIEQLYVDACEGGDYYACNVFGVMYETGRDVPRDLSRARRFYRIACQGGLAVGCTNLGLLFGRGLGTPRDLERARGLYSMACTGGNPLGCDLLGFLNRVKAGKDSGAFVVNGEVLDRETLSALSGAIVYMPELEVRQISDHEGHVAFDLLPAGEHHIVVRRAGYADVESTVRVPESDDFVILMDSLPARDSEATGTVADGGAAHCGDKGSGDGHPEGRRAPAYSSTGPAPAKRSKISSVIATPRLTFSSVTRSLLPCTPPASSRGVATAL